MTPPVASILIPCGPNHTEWLDRAVESAKAQTVPVEVLPYVDHDRQGPGFGRNLLAKQAQGLFLCMLDADDYLYPHAVETMLKHWRPGSYVYSDWHEVTENGERRHIEATSCYIDWRYNAPDQRTYHLTPVLFPARIYHALGGMDETLRSAEDTDFFFKANVAGVISIRVHEPLFVYTDDGGHARSTEGKQQSDWLVDLAKLFSRYQKEAKVACCGDISPRNVLDAAHADGDILVHTQWKGKRRIVGRVTGRQYGRHGNGKSLWMDPRDAAAEPRFFAVATNMEALSPEPDEIDAALAQGGMWTMAQRIARAGVRNWATMEKPGLDMQQVPEEIGAFLDFALEHGVQTVLEIGTGESGGLARFMAGELGWHVTSIDLSVPGAYIPARFEQGEGMTFESGGFWRVIQANSQEPGTIDLGQDTFDLVFIDGDHTAEAVRADHANYAGLATKIVAFHDIHPAGYWTDVATYWQEIAYTKSGRLKKNFFDVSVNEAKTGLGYYVVD